MKKCIVIDDEPLGRQLIEDYIKKTDDFELVKSFGHPIEALQFIQIQPPDLIFLDIQMPELSGIQLMKILDRRYPIIITTAFEQYALEGFEWEVIDYLLKPISYERFYRALEKLNAFLLPGEKNKAEGKPLISDYIFIKSEYRFLRLDLKDIYFIEGLGDYVAIHTQDKKILSLENLKSFEKELPETEFMRVHKSYIISFSKIEYIERGRIVAKGQRIPISDSYKKQFWERIHK